MAMRTRCTGCGKVFDVAFTNEETHEFTCPACGKVEVYKLSGVMTPRAERIKFVEALLGADLPADLRSFLKSRSSPPGDLSFLSSCGRELTVRDFFRLDHGADYLQLDSTFERVHDALPKGMLPFARDMAGNFYCIVVTGAQAGRIVWWNHEREFGDNRVEDVAPSFREFMLSAFWSKRKS